MDLFNSYLQTAQAQAKAAALSAQKSAKGFAQQVQEHTKVIAEQVTENTKTLAEQASTLSTAAAESAQHKLRALDGFKAPLGKPEEPDMPAPAELAAFGVTAELLDFVRSLTYSTFRDFPTETLPPPVQVNASSTGKRDARDAKYLTPWQEHHAMLVVRCCREVNELRYVLCPKRMRDEQFWQIYFLLAKRLLPPEAFDPAYRLPSSNAASLNFTDLSAQFTRLSTSAKQWGAQTGATLATVASGHLPGHAAPPQHANSLAACRAGPASPSSRGLEGGSPGSAAAPRAEAGLGRDQELEAYLRDVMHDDARGSAADAARDAGGSSSGRAAVSVDESYVDARPSGSDEADPEDDDDDADDDFEKYLHELSNSEAGEEEAGGGHGAKTGKGQGAHKGDEEGEEEDSGDDLDLDEYMRVLADEDK